MKKENFNYFLVGIFVLLGMLVLFLMMFKITGGDANADSYSIEFKQVTGIKDGVVVTYSGYAIGTVQSLEPVINENKVTYKLTVMVKSGWKIPRDSRAKIVMPAIISDKQIEITQGISREFLSPGDEIKSDEAVDIMKFVDSIAGELNSFIPQSTKNINRLVNNLNHSADQVTSLLSDKNVQHLNNLFEHADSSGQSLAQLTAGLMKINKQLDGILNSTELILSENSRDIRYSVVEMKKSIDVVSSRIESIMYNLDSSSRNMNEFSREIRNNPAGLLGGKPPADKQHNQ